MTPAIWAINGNNPSFYGVTVAGGSFRASQASSVTLHTNHPADAAEQFTDGQSVTIDRNGAVFFTGKVRQIARRADDAAEGHD